MGILVPWVECGIENRDWGMDTIERKIGSRECFYFACQNTAPYIGYANAHTRRRLLTQTHTHTYTHMYVQVNVDVQLKGYLTEH